MRYKTVYPVERERTGVGETGDSAFHRQTEHAGDIKRKQTKNGKHLEIFHPDQTGYNFVFEVNTETICGESES